jgi:hypothetical protein
MVFARIDEFSARFTGVDQFPGGSLADSFGVAVAVDCGREDCGVAFVDGIANCLTDEVIGYREAREIVFLEKLPTSLHVAVFIEGFLDIEMVAPTGEFNAIVAHVFDFGEKFGKRKVGPLAGE